MKKLILIGGGGHCRSCIEAIELEGQYRIVGIIDFKEKVGQEVSGYKITDTDNNLERYLERNQENYFLITVGQIRSAELRSRLFDQLKLMNAKMATIISPLAHVSKHAKIGEGTIILNHALINSGAKIGKNCIINSKALIEHDTTIGDNCHISIGSVIGGETRIGKNSFIGANATIVNCVRVPKDSFIKAGSLIKN